MAAYYGAEYQAAYLDVPSTKIRQGDLAGSPKRMYFSWAVPAAAITLNSTVDLGVLPKGARLYDAVLQFPDQGTTGTATLGTAASAELDSDGSAVEAAVANSILTTVDMKAAADAVSMKQQMEAGGTNAAYLKRYSADVVVQLKITEAFDVGTGTVKGYIEYIQE